MPIYNGIEFIHDSISSVLNQTYKDWELIIGINGHEENSDVFYKAKVFELLSNKIRVYDFYNIKGKSNTLNHMIQFCKYNYVALLDVDDIWRTDKLQIQSAYLNEYDVLGSRCSYFGDRNYVVPYIPVNDEICTHDFLQSNPVINSSAIIHKELCYWNAYYDGIEDYDLWLRLWKMNKKFYNCSDILVYHRIHSSSAFNSQNLENKLNALQISFNNT